MNDFIVSTANFNHFGRVREGLKIVLSHQLEDYQ